MSGTYIVVMGFFVFVTFLVGCGFRLIGLTLLHIQSLPSLPKYFANLPCIIHIRVRESRLRENTNSLDQRGRFTKADSRVLFPHVVALLICEEHIGRKSALGCIWV